MVKYIMDHGDIYSHQATQALPKPTTPIPNTAFPVFISFVPFSSLSLSYGEACFPPPLTMFLLYHWHKNSQPYPVPNPFTYYFVINKTPNMSNEKCILAHICKYSPGK